MQYKFLRMNEFDKTNKTRFSEWHIKNYLEEFDFDTFTPHSDNGIDILGIRDDLKVMFQVKTRRLNDEGDLGFTLKDKDFYSDPRKVFVLFEDDLDKKIFLTISDFLELFVTGSIKSVFIGLSFRQGNNKINSIHWNGSEFTLGKKIGSISLEKYTDEVGLKRVLKYIKEVDFSLESARIAEQLQMHMYDISKDTHDDYAFEKQKPLLKNKKIDSNLINAEESYYKKERDWKNE